MIGHQDTRNTAGSINRSQSRMLLLSKHGAPPEENERGIDFTLSIQPAWLMRTNMCACLGHSENGCEAMADSLRSMCYMNKRMKLSAS